MGPAVGASHTNEGNLIKGMLEPQIGGAMVKSWEIAKLKREKIKQRDLLRLELQRNEGVAKANDEDTKQSKERRLKTKCHLAWVREDKIKKLNVIGKEIAQLTSDEKAVTRDIDMKVDLYYRI